MLNRFVRLGKVIGMVDGMRRRDFVKLTGMASAGLVAGTAGAAGTANAQPAATGDIEHIISRMTLAEKIHLVHGRGDFDQNGKATGYIPPLPRLGIPEIRLEDGPVGVRRGQATAFPASISAAATWHPELVHRAGAAMGSEAKAKRASSLLAPAFDINRVPVGGRTFEYYSEDPYLSATLAVAAVRGIQSEGVIACAKHYACNNQEADRETVSVDVNDRALYEIYLPSFQAAVSAGGVGSIMAAYNKLAGTYCSENHRLLTDILKHQWGFAGYVVSDWGGTHSTAPAANAGLDMEMPGQDSDSSGYFDSELLDAVRRGEVGADVIDDKVRRILRQLERFGIMHGPRPGGPGEVDTPRHRALTRQVATEGIVLLRNEHEVLPIDPRPLNQIAVIGTPAVTAKVGGGGSSEVSPPYVIRPLDALQGKIGGSVQLDYVSGEPIEDAVALAREADLALVFAADDSTEGEDRSSMRLPGNQDTLISEVAKANPNTVVVLKTGAPVPMPWLDAVRGVLEAWFPGQEDGNAIADILVGDANPGGKLPVTFGARFEDYPANTRRRYPGVDHTVHYEEGIFVGYRHFDAQQLEPLFPFGHGLSYTTFEYGSLHISPVRTEGKRAWDVSLRVTNSGSRDGTEVVQLYLSDLESSVARPPRELKGFQRVQLAAGDSSTVTLRVDDGDLAFYSPEQHRWMVEPGKFGVHVGSSSRDIRLNGEITAP